MSKENELKALEVAQQPNAMAKMLGTPPLSLSDDQQKAINAMVGWWHDVKTNGVNSRNQIFYLAGWAGTGKTTIANEFIQTFPEETKIKFGSFTGKAAYRMQQAGMEGAQTLHSMIYNCEEDMNGKLRFFKNPGSILKYSDLLILDECSMVDEFLGKDVCSYNIPILILGDPGQLPPIKGQGYFTNRKPNATLTEVHRQALENPIIRLATDIRMGRPIIKFNEPELITYAKNDQVLEAMISSDQMLCGKNVTRNHANSFIREHLNFSHNEYPRKDERVICLRNNRTDGLFNGQIGIMLEDASMLDDDKISISFHDELDENEIYKNVKCHKEGFIDDSLFKDMENADLKLANQFTYSYAITVHKSQGSQWDSVCMLDDNFLVWDKGERNKWLYTGITRAANKLVLGKPKGIL